MNIDAEKIEKQEINLPYEQPSLNKYGTMKSIVKQNAGSFSGGGRQNVDNPNQVSNTTSDPADRGEMD